MGSRKAKKGKEQERTVLYSRTAGYAIRAFVHLGELPKDGFATNKDIAAAEDLPAPHLSKILQYFAKTGLLRSVKGPSGGFALDIAISFGHADV